MEQGLAIGAIRESNCRSLLESGFPELLIKKDLVSPKDGISTTYQGLRMLKESRKARSGHLKLRA
jgi:hypothetical protein